MVARVEGKTAGKEFAFVEADYHVAFSVGGLRAAFEAGALHALMVSDAPKPGIIAGSSIGATNAVALAELYALRARARRPGDAPDRPMDERDRPWVRRLRTQIELFLQQGDAVAILPALSFHRLASGSERERMRRSHEQDPARRAADEDTPLAEAQRRTDGRRRLFERIFARLPLRFDDVGAGVRAYIEYAEETSPLLRLQKLAGFYLRALWASRCLFSRGGLALLTTYLGSWPWWWRGPAVLRLVCKGLLVLVGGALLLPARLPRPLFLVTLLALVLAVLRGFVIGLAVQPGVTLAALGAICAGLAVLLLLRLAPELRERLDDALGGLTVAPKPELRRLLRALHVHQSIFSEQRLVETLEEAFGATLEASDNGAASLADACADSGTDIIVCVGDMHSARAVTLPPGKVRLLDALLAANAVPWLWPAVTPERVYREGQSPAPGDPQGPFVDAVQATPLPFARLLYRLKYGLIRRALAEQDPRAAAQRIARSRQCILTVSTIPGRLGPYRFEDEAPVADEGHDYPLQFSNLIQVAERSLALFEVSEKNLDLKLAEFISEVLSGERGADLREAYSAQTEALLEAMRRDPEQIRGTPYNGPSSASELGDEAAPSYADLLLQVEILRVEPSESITFRNPNHPTREEIARTIADGCRTTLARLWERDILPSDLRPTKDRATTVPCRSFLASQAQARGARPFRVAGQTPGLPEVCQACVLGDARQVVPAPPLPAVCPDDEAEGAEQAEEVEKAAGAEETEEAAGAEQAGAPCPPPVAPAPLPPRLATSWHRASEDRERASTRPLVSLALGGGVFRGVFQFGMVHALACAGVRPELVAGASVGTVMGALGAKILTQADPVPAIAQAATFFLTAGDWVRTRSFRTLQWSLLERLEASSLSLEDLHLVLRRFDLRPGSYERRKLKVLGAAQRLLHIGPHEFERLWDLARGDDSAAFLARLRHDLIRALSRYGVSLEVLGAQKIQEMVEAWGLGETLDAFLKGPAGAEGRGIHLLAMATDLQGGRLKRMGLEDWDRPEGQRSWPPRLVPALLASAAFPAVFAPRQEIELYPLQGSAFVQLSDGGLVNNYPVDEALQFLRRASQDATQAHPDSFSALHANRLPHLLLYASLDRDPQPQRYETAPDLIDVAERSGAFSYNYKVRRYEALQTRLRRLIRRAQGGCSSAVPRAGTPPLAVKVVPVFPEWMVGTFAFTRSLGFDEAEQARSIAHGCRRTLARLATLAQELATEYGDDADPQALRAAYGSWTGLRLRPDDREPRQDGTCHHFERLLQSADGPPRLETLPCHAHAAGTRVNRIYSACWVDHRESLRRASRRGRPLPSI